MKPAKIFTGMLLATILILSQIGVAFAAQPSVKATSVSGTVTEVTLLTNPSTGIVTVAVTVKDQAGGLHTVRISEKTAAKLGLVAYDSADGNPFIVNPPPPFVEIDAKNILTDEEPRHPVANAIATFFSDVEGLNYGVIMEAHGNGFGFGVIAEALWLIEKMGGTVDDFFLLLDAKKNNDFTDFVMEDGTIPASWAELKQAVADKQLGLIMSKRDEDKPGKDQGPSSNANANGNKDKDKNKDKPSNASNGQGKGNGGNKP